MSGDRLQKVVAGQRGPLSAATWNTFVDAARDFLQRQLDGGSPSAATPRPYGTILVENLTGGDVDLFGIVGIDGPVFGPDDSAQEFQFRPALKGVVPSDHFGRFAVLLAPLKAGAIGPALVDGVTAVRVRLPDPTHPPQDPADASIQYADVCNVEGEETVHLELQARGAGRVLWMEAADNEETGDRWALVRLSNASPQERTAAVHALKVTGVYGAYGVTFNPAQHRFILYVTGYFAFADKSWYDDSTEYIVKATHSPATAAIGFKTIQVGDFVGYVLADGFEAVPGGQNQETYAGQVIPFPGPEGALLSTSTKIDGGPGIIVEPNADPSKDEPKVSVELAGQDPGLEFDAQGDDGKLKVLPDETAGVTVTDDGVAVKLEEDGNGQKSGGLEFAQDGDLKVLPNENEGITVKLQGVSAKLEPDGGLVFAADGDMMVQVDPTRGIDVDHDGLFVVVDPTRGIDVDANGVFALADATRAVSITQDGIGVDVDGNYALQVSGNKVQVVVKTGGGIELTGGALDIPEHADGGLQHREDGRLGVKADSSRGLDTDTDGVFVRVGAGIAFGSGGDAGKLIHASPGAALAGTGSGSGDGTSIVRTIETDAKGNVRRYFRNWHAGGGVWQGQWEGPCA